MELYLSTLLVRGPFAGETQRINVKSLGVIFHVGGLEFKYDVILIQLKGTFFRIAVFEPPFLTIKDIKEAHRIWKCRKSI